jgi:hypothetical protein
MPQLSSRRSLALVLVLTAAGCLGWVALGQLLARIVSHPDAAGFAFIIYTAHLSPMILTEGLSRGVRRSRARRRTSRGRLKRRLRTSRARRWPFPWVYVSLAPQLWMASLGLGLVPGWQPDVLPYVLAVGLTLWRFVLVRVGPEQEGRPHTPGLKPKTRIPVLLNYFADGPFAAIAFVAYAVTGQAIWILAVILIVTYSFLVRAGQYVGDTGPYVYSAALVSLVCSALVVWPISTKWYPDWTEWPLWLAPVALSLYQLVLDANTVKISLSKRVLHFVGLGILLAYALYVTFSKGHANFSEGAILTPHDFGSNAVVTALTVAMLPLGFYIFLMQIGESRELLLSENPDMGNFQIFKRKKRR